MALKFRRGTTAQKSGSLAFGEPFINTDLNTLQIGGASGDITLGTTGESSAFAGVSVSASSFISGSGLKITGNAAIDGNLTLGGAITIGDATADTVNVVASLSSSLIPSNDNTFDVGRNDKRYRAIYSNTLSASVLEIESGSWAEVRLKNSSTGIDYHIQNTTGGNFSIHNAESNQSIFRIDSGSFPQHAHFFGNLIVGVGFSSLVSVGAPSLAANSITASGTISGSIEGIGNVSSYSSSVNSRLVVVEGVSASAASALNNVSGAFATTVSSLGGNYATDAELSAVSSAVAVRDAAQDVLISSLQSNIVSASVFNTYSSSVNSRILTEKGRVDAILSASTADADTFAEIVTLINSVDTTSDTVFGGFVTSSNATNNTQNARLSALETETGSIATAQSAQNARLTSLETTSGSHNSRLSNLEGFSSSLNSTFATDAELSSVSGAFATTIGNLGSTYATDAELSSVSGAFATSQASQDTLIASLRTNVVSASVFTTFSTSVDSRLDSVELVSASAASALNSFSASNAATDATQTTNISTATAAAAGAFASASAYSASAAVVDAAQDVLIASLRNNVVSASVFTTFSTSVDSRLDSVELVSASAAGALNSVSGAFNTTINNLGSTYATDAELSSLSASVATRNAGQDTTISTLSSSVDSRLDVVEGVSASAASALNSLSSSASSAYAKIGSTNTFNGTQTISGSLIVTQDLVIGGSASIQHVTSSQLNISDNIITVNTINPTVRFGGLAVIDSGSAQSGSFLYDSVHDEFVFVHRGDGTNITSSHFLVGPETYNDLGNETYLTANKIIKSKGNEHIVESNITDNGTTITLGSNTSVTGTLVATGTSLVSASAQITLSSTTGYSTFSSSVAATDSAQDTTISTLSSSVNSRLLVVEAVSSSAASALNSFSASNAATDATQTTNITTATTAAAGAFASASAYSASAAVVDAGQDTLIASLRNNVVSASVFTTFSTSVDSRLDSVELVSASAAGALNSVSGAFATTIGNLDNTYATDASVTSVSGAFATTISNLGSTYATDAELSAVSSAVATTIGNLGSTYATDVELSAVSSAVATRDAAQDVLISSLQSNVVSASVFTTFSTSVDSRLDAVEAETAALESFTSSFNTAFGLSGANVTVKGNLTVQGLTTQIDSTTVNIADNIIQLNGTGATNAGLVVRDATAATTTSGSFLWDTANDKWIAGPLGSEDDVVLRTLGQTLTNKTISGASNTLSNIANASLTNSSITIAGTSTALGGSITAATILGGTGVISGSAGLPAGIVSGSSQITASVFGAVSGDITITAAGVATIGANSVALGTDTTGDYVSSLVAGTNITLSNNSGEGATPTIGLTNNTISIAGTSTSLGGTISAATIGNAIGAFSSSAQVAHDSTTGYSANRHIDHTAVTITAGAGLTGGGDISANRTINVAAGNYITVNADDVAVNTATLIPAISGTILSSITGDVTITAGGVATIGANSVALGTDTTGNYVASLVAGTNITLSNNSGEGATPTIGLTNNTISGIALGSNLATLTIGTGLSGTSYNGSGAVTIANTGVTSNVAGTGVTVSGATGAVTISIGQAVATSDNVRFNSLGIGMAASATAGRIDATNDIVAFSSSDIRFKENIKPIENAIDKIRKISGNTYDWKEENKIEHGYEGNDVGVIAQEIEAVLPQLVQTRESGYKAVKYDKLVALLIEGIKEQQLQIEQLRIDLDNCRNKGL